MRTCAKLLPYTYTTCTNIVKHKDGMKSHSCISCGLRACNECNSNLDTNQNYICNNCSDTIKESNKIPLSFLRMKARSS